METIALASAFALDHLSNDDLLASTRAMVGRSNLVLAALLAHLAEVEARRLYRLRACPSLYSYCVYELRMSEDAANRRAQAARFVRKFPLLLGRVAAGELHLTGLLMLGPHLTEENLAEVLELAKHRTKKETAALVRRIDPLPDVPAQVEPLGPAEEGRPMQNPTWADFMASMCPIRDLPEGERPRDWLPEGLAKNSPIDDRDEPASEREGVQAPQRYKVQFTASEEYVKLLDEARDLLAVRSHAIEEVHLRAMRLLVEQLKKRKCAATESPRQRGTDADESPRQRGTGSAEHSRYIPAAVRRAVWDRDEGRCSYVDERGQRCRETSGLELHHEHPFAKGGPPSAANLSLRCKPHNDLAAEQDFGSEHMLRAKGQLPALAR